MLEVLNGLPEADVAQIARIEVRTYAEALRFCDRSQPSTELEAKFSLQHALASILVHGRPQLDHYTAEACSDADVLHWRSRVDVAEDSGCSQRFPAHYGATVQLWLEDGRSVACSRIDAWGDPECPMSSDDVIAKAMALAQWGGVSAGLAQSLFGQVQALADGGSLDALNTMLARVA
ncbi:MmgE/PrpD family protein [compost metagenome]